MLMQAWKTCARAGDRKHGGDEARGTDALDGAPGGRTDRRTAEGDPYPGVALYAPQAREIAYRLLQFAQELESKRGAGHRF